MWIEVVGGMGMGMLLVTFYLASSKKISDQLYTYHVLNLVGAMAVFVNAVTKGVCAVATLEVVWSFIALIGIWKVHSGARGRHALE